MKLDTGQLKLIKEHSVLKELSKLFKKSKKEIFLVGGCVRDILQNNTKSILDFDIATEAAPEETLELVKGWADSIWLIGIKFGTIALNKDDYKIEITTLRTEKYREKSRHPEVSYQADIGTDLSRRDFTINAMAISIPDGELLDPFGGYNDLRAKVLRTPLSPKESFLDDPLRMMRAARFASNLNLEIDPSLIEAMREFHTELVNVSKERVREELNKILLGPKPFMGLKILVDTNLMKEIIPELIDLQIAHDPDYHHKDVLEHSLTVVEKVPPNLTQRLAALLHDLAKPKTKEVTDGRTTFYGHDVQSSHMARKILMKLKYPKKLIEEVTTLIYLHMRAYTYRSGWSDKAVRRYVRDANGLLEELNQLIRADCTSKMPQTIKEAQKAMDELEERIIKLEEEEESAKIRPPIDGYQVMEYLVLESGPKVGQIMEILLEARLAGEIETEEEAFKLVDKWASENDIEKRKPLD